MQEDNAHCWTLYKTDGPYERMRKYNGCMVALGWTPRAGAVPAGKPGARTGGKPTQATEKRLHETWKWPKAAGTASDLVADSKSCTQPPRPGDDQPYANLARYARCMQDKGWVMRKQAKPDSPGAG